MGRLKMKKYFLLSLFIFVSLFLVTGCGDKKDDNKSNNEEKKDIIKEENTSLVLYFSATGTTKKIAERIANKAGSDLIEIVPKEKYTSDDLNYNGDCRANREQNDDKARPEIENKIDISKYNTIYLGYPIWWGTNPRIILTLLDSYDFSNKVIITFCTSGSSGISTSVSDLRKYNSKLNIKDGKRFTTSASDQVIEDFIKNNK
jgi:flavodoxin